MKIPANTELFHHIRPFGAPSPQGEGFGAERPQVAQSIGNRRCIPVWTRSVRPCAFAQEGFDVSKGQCCAIEAEITWDICNKSRGENLEEPGDEILSI